LDKCLKRKAAPGVKIKQCMCNVQPGLPGQPDFLYLLNNRYLVITLLFL